MHIAQTMLLLASSLISALSVELYPGTPGLPRRWASWAGWATLVGCSRGAGERWRSQAAASGVSHEPAQPAQLALVAAALLTGHPNLVEESGTVREARRRVVHPSRVVGSSNAFSGPPGGAKRPHSRVGVKLAVGRSRRNSALQKPRGSVRRS